MLGRHLTLAALAAVLLITALPASADESVKVGKSVPQAFGFTPLNVGIEKGIFKKNGVEVEAVDFGGAPRLAQGLISNAVEMGLGSGPDMANIVKGAPIKAVGAVGLFQAAQETPLEGCDGVADGFVFHRFTQGADPGLRTGVQLVMRFQGLPGFEGEAVVHLGAGERILQGFI